MSAVVIIDTSIFLNVLDVPSFNQDRRAVFQDFQNYIQDGANILLPMAAIFETGNHIAQLSNGGNRRRFAAKFADQVKKALSGDAPWHPTQTPTTEMIDMWIDEFPDSAMRGASMSDLSIVKEWQAAVIRHSHLRTLIWSLDDDLAGYDHRP
jgi:hypothetical protein